MRNLRRSGRGFTLIELLVVVAVAVVLLAIGVGSFRDWIIEERLKSVTSQLVSDLQYARSEAAARNMAVYFSYASEGSTQTCYSIYTTTTSGAFCTCSLTPPCPLASQTELRTVSVPRSGAIRLAPVPRPPPGTGSPVDFAYDNLTGGVVFGTLDFPFPAPTPFSLYTLVVADPEKRLRTTVGAGGQVTVCNWGSKKIHGYQQCP